MDLFICKSNIYSHKLNLLCFDVVLIVGATVNGILHLVIPTIERRFNLRSVKSGLVSGGYDIASLICLIPVTYFGGRPNASKPRWIGVGMIIMGIGAFIFALPHFIKKASYQTSENGKSLCNNNTLEIKVKYWAECSYDKILKKPSLFWALKFQSYCRQFVKLKYCDSSARSYCLIRCEHCSC